jgi:hypothetical protein
MCHKLYHTNSSDKLLDSIGNFILWTVVECSLGIIAGSMPMLRKLFKSLRKDDSSYNADSNDINLVTIGKFGASIILSMMGTSEQPLQLERIERVIEMTRVRGG